MRPFHGMIDMLRKTHTSEGLVVIEGLDEIDGPSEGNELGEALGSGEEDGFDVVVGDEEGCILALG